MKRQRVFFLLKLMTGIICVWLVIHFGHMNLRELVALKGGWIWMAAAASCMIGEIALAAIRWKVMLKGFNLNITSLNSLRAIWIGQFLGTFMPGALGSDIVRTLYLVRDSREKPTRIAASVIGDRLLGLVALLVVASLSSFLFLGPMPPAIEKFIQLIPVFAAFSALGTLLALGLLLKPHLLSSHVAALVHKLIGTFHSKDLSLALLFNFFLAILSQLGMVAIFYCLWRALGEDIAALDVGKLLIAVPVSLIVMTLPIAPSGIGVGQAAFAIIFSMLAIPSKTLGANMVSLFQVVSLLTNLVGVVPFVVGRRQKHFAFAPPEGLQEQNV
ncbi:MAG: lysylphosphatidylglycerol synthase transmembrane domain-containing protein [Bdellovibrionales bacterium]